MLNLDVYTVETLQLNPESLQKTIPPPRVSYAVLVSFKPHLIGGLSI